MSFSRFLDTNILLYSISRELLSEDMSHGQVVDSVTILNPFL